MLIDIVSDLHVDFWSDDRAYDWKANQVANIVIVAGDVADSLELTVTELQKACAVYDKVMYVSGNHEATDNYDDLSATDREIRKRMQGHTNFFLLSDSEVVTDNRLVFVGATGWWDFKICEPEFSARESKAEFDSDWCPNKDLAVDTIIRNIERAAHDDYLRVKATIDRYKADHFVCVVTHTVPHKDLLSRSYPLERKYAGCYGNSRFSDFFEEKAVRCFVFGHNHDSTGVTMLGDKLCVNNARGRPNDYNRVDYTPITIDLH